MILKKIVCNNNGIDLQNFHFSNLIIFLMCYQDVIILNNIENFNLVIIIY